MTFTEVWSALGDIPIDIDENIEISFMGYPIDTNKYDIWHDLEEDYNISIGDYLTNGGSI